MSFGIPVRNGLGLGLLASTSLATGNVGGPALYLPFALTGTLDSRITFSRPSLATMYDSTGKLTYAPNNLLTNNTNPDLWTKSGVSSVVGQVVTFTGAGSFQQVANSGWGGTALMGQRFVFGATLSGSGTITLDCNGATGTSTITLTGTPTWYSVVVTAAATVSLSARIISYPGNTATSFTMTNAYFSAVTYETSQRAADFINTTSAAYYGPRFDYDPATLVARGLLIEEARTNMVAQSAMGTGLGSWLGNASTRTLSTEITPDGTQSAMQIVTTGNSGLNLSQVMNTVVSSVYTASMWLKGTSGQQIYFVATDTAAGQELITFTGSWQRVTKTFTATSTASYIGCELFNRSGGASLPNVTFNAWGAQYELGSFATSYIPTGASSVTRSADSVTMTGTNFSSWYNQTQGTFVVNSNIEGRAAAASYVFAASDGSANEIVGGFVTTASHRIGFVVDGGVTQVDLNAGATLVNTDYKIAFAYKPNDFAASLNGASPLTATVGTIPTPSEMGIGSRGGSSFFNGWIASIAYYNNRLADATLQSLTLPVIADYYFLVTAGGDQLTDASDNPLYTQPLYL